ncbi:MAG: hypothetical protein Q4A49_05775 [Neisseria sp.]|nr:hypothetical protein [Neisseria sp.]
MKLTFAISDLLWENEHSLPELHTPGLNSLLRFGKISRPFRKVSDLYGTFLWKGSLRMQALHELGLPPDTPAVLASPVSQRMGMHSMNTLSGRNISANLQEAAIFCRDLNDFYAADGIIFYPYRRDLWLAVLPQLPDWQVPAATDIFGQIDGSMRAEGRDAAQWLRMQTEIQMFLHNHKLNEKRISDGMPALNGLWLWPDSEGQGVSGLIAADNDWGNNRHHALPYDWAAAERWQTEENTDGCHDGAVVFLEDLSATQHSGDIWAYQTVLEDWDKRFFAPAWQALREGCLTTLNIHSNGGSLTVRAKAHRAFWKRKKTLKDWSDLSET